MDAKWILLFYIVKVHFEVITSQRHYHHHPYYDDALQQYDDDDDIDETDESSELIRRRFKHRKSADSDECYCFCETCYSRVGLKSCCIEFCKYCRSGPNLPEQYPNQEQKVVFVPFPYPLIVPNTAQNDNTQNNNEQNEIPQNNDAVTEKVTPQDNTLREAVTTPKAEIKPKTGKTSPVKSNKKNLRAKSVEVEMLSKHRQMKQLNPAVKRTRPAWIPKYGIVPIPDHLAAKLMTQLTEVRALKAKGL